MKRGSLKRLVGHQRTDAPLQGMRGGLGAKPLIRGNREEKPLPVIRRVAGYPYDTLSWHCTGAVFSRMLAQMLLAFYFPAQFRIDYNILVDRDVCPTNRQTKQFSP